MDCLALRVVQRALPRHLKTAFPIILYTRLALKYQPPEYVSAYPYVSAHRFHTQLNVK
jgi:hypothetical protein